MSSRLRFVLTSIAVSMALVIGVTRSVAQSGGTASITAVNVVTTSATNATLSFSYSSSVAQGLLRYVVKYGQTSQYGSNSLVTTFDQVLNTQSVTLQGLKQGTTYHFAVEILGSDSAVLATSADRTFTTATSGGDSSQLLIERIRVDCVSTNCNIYFATTKDASVEVRWDTQSRNAFTDYGTGSGEGSASNTFRSLNFPNPTQTALTPNTIYHYRLQAVGANGASFTTGDQTFTTSANSSDHVFATGQCTSSGSAPISVDIGSCLGSQYCSAAGVFVSDCSKCGYLCESGKTCRTGSSGAYCDQDVQLNGAPTQCNASSCYDGRGVLVSPATAGCVSTWPKCNANTILKVRNDRGCNVWLSCATSIQTDGTTGGAGENLCLALGACNSLNANGQCNNYLPLGQCNNDPLRFCNADSDCQNGGTCNTPDPDEPTKALQELTYQTPRDIEKIANLSGNVVAGLDWGEQGGANVIQGNLPWQMMRQVGGDAQISNGDLEFRAPEITPWNPVPETLTPSESLKIEFEDKNSGPNHVLLVEPVTQVQVTGRCSNNTAKTCTASSECGTGGTCGTQTVAVPFSGAATNTFTASPSEFYYAEARIRGVGGTPVVRVQFGHGNYTKFTVTTTVNGTSTSTNTFADIATTAAWQRVTLGPLKGMSGITKLAFVCADAANCGKFEIDDVVVKPILQINTDPSYITPSCRLYPKNDSPSCDYADTNGVQYKGWKGYCLENDSQTGTCLSWWPVDIIKGESSIFGSEKAAGYQDRAPLYMCAETLGLAKKSEVGDGQFTSKVGYMYGSAYAGIYTFKIESPDRTISSPLSGIFQTAGHQTEKLPKRSIMGIDGYGSSTTDRGKYIEYFHFDAQDFSAVEAQTGNPVATERVFYTYNKTQEITLRASTISASSLNDPSGAAYPASYTAWQIDTNGCTMGTTAGGGELAGPNCIFMQYVFNAAGELIEERYDGGDFEGQDANAAEYVVLFQVRELCTKVVQVVTPEGQSSAFASRVQSAVYKVADLNYGLSTDLGPFGGALQPLENNPILWPPLGAEKMNTTRTPSGLSRSGSPYACTGAGCGAYACVVHTPLPYGQLGDSQSVLQKVSLATDACATNPTICQNIDSDNDQVGDGQCVGVSTAEPASKGAQSFATSLSCVKPTGSATGYCGGIMTCGPLSGAVACSATKRVTGSGVTPSAALADAANSCGFVATGANINLSAGQVTGTNGRLAACDGTFGRCSGTIAMYNKFQATAPLYTCTKVQPQDCDRNNTGPGKHCSFTGLACAFDRDCPDVAQPTNVANCSSTRSGSSACTCTVSGSCSTTNTYKKGTVDPDPTKSTICTTDDQCAAVVNPFYAQERIKRLFAQSYGVWTDLRCNDAAANACVLDSDCATDVSCINRASNFGKVANSDPSENTGAFVGWNPPSVMCAPNPAYQVSSCTSSSIQCTAKLQVSGQSTAKTDTAATRQEALVAALGSCGLVKTGTDDLPYAAGVVITGTLDATGGKLACNGVNTECPGSAAYVAGTTAKFTTLTLDKPCSYSSTTGYTCTGSCSSTSEYINASKPVVASQSKYLRPKYVANSQADYCAIPPEVSNVKFTVGSATTATITGGSGSIGVKFNTSADQEQVPLGRIRIDWGDSQDEFSFPYAPRNDAAKPHIFSHTYVVNRGDVKHCTTSLGRTTCQFPIKIQVQDSWGWCNDANATTKCHNDELGNGRIDSTSWYDTGLKVIVRP